MTVAGPITEVVDPVCKMTIDPADAAGSSTYNGTTYYFCMPDCKEKFDADPESFLRPQASGLRPNEDAWYTCPMHPEVRQKGPGACPKCGMALEPERITLEEED